MKVRDTSRGRMYAVSSNPGCTVINGDMAVDVPAGGQSVILALDKKLIIEGDDNAKFVEVRWGTNAAVGSRPAPSWMGDVVDGIVSIVGEGKFDINYLPVENKLVVHTDRVSDELSEEVTELLASVVPQDVEVVRYNHHIEVSWRDINKYANIRTSKELSEFVTKEEFQNDLTSDGCWVYPMPEFTGTFGWYSAPTAGWFRANPKLRYVEFYAPKSYITIGWFSPNSNLEEVWCEAGYGYDANSFFSSCPNLKKITAIFPEGTALNNLCSGCKNLEDVDISFKDTTTGNNFYFENIFRGCILNKVSVLRFVDRLPDSSKAYQNKTMMTLGLDVNLQNDDEVLEAIAAAEEKGWTLTVQWNPGGPTYTTPEASTMAMGTLIYAKVGEHELPDGTAERYLDWGHYVTNWEERGYEQFRSLESAYEYFNLPIPESETEEELQIEEIENA